MANFQWAFAGQVFTIQWLAPFQTTGLFPQARIIDANGSLVSGGPFNLTANATIAYLYENTGWTPASEQQYSIVIDVYTDAGRTTLHESFDSTTIDIRVKDIGASMRGGSLGGTNKLDRGDLALLIERISEEVWKKVFPTGKTAQTTLIEKSVFDAKRDKVKTDIKIPKVELSGLEDKITESELAVLGAIKVLQPEQINKAIVKESARLIFVIGELQQKLSVGADSLQSDVHKVADMVVNLDKSVAKKELAVPIGNLLTTCNDLQVRLDSIKKNLPVELASLKEELKSLQVFFQEILMPFKGSVEELQKELQINGAMMEVLDKKQLERFNKMAINLSAMLNKILLSNQISLVEGVKYSQINE